MLVPSVARFPNFKDNNVITPKTLSRAVFNKGLEMCRETTFCFNFIRNNSLQTLLTCSPLRMCCSACCLAQLLSRESTILAREGRRRLLLPPPPPKAPACALDARSTSEAPPTAPPAPAPAAPAAGPPRKECGAAPPSGGWTRLESAAFDSFPAEVRLFCPVAATKPAPSGSLLAEKSTGSWQLAAGVSAVVHATEWDEPHATREILRQRGAGISRL